jgi:hypothetical protein
MVKLLIQGQMKNMLNTIKYLTILKINWKVIWIKQRILKKSMKVKKSKVLTFYFKNEKLNKNIDDLSKII